MRLPRLLLVPQPPLSLAHVLAIRAGWVSPSWAPVFALAALPAAALAIALGRRPRDVGATAIAVLELGWSAVHAAMVGMAIGIRSG